MYDFKALQGGVSMFEVFLNAVPEDLVKIALSMLLGGLLGFEREFHDKPAGFKTNVLISLGATLFSIVSLKVGAAYFQDPGRIAAQIVTGVGFLGTGAILREGAHITGLTTAAMIWLVASVGCGVGFGYYKISAFTTVGALIVQLVLFRLDHLILAKKTRQHIYHIRCSPDPNSPKMVLELFNRFFIRLLDKKVTRQKDVFFMEVHTIGGQWLHDEFLQTLLKSEYVEEVKF
ncbi:MAG: hypothetical protein A3G41_08940 [Elusimicrobia bacterium RIFCSPLOWO2_12_FULL_59_9]|nr:MAG: hypothetical protein A3G41_08940 [Elusimicrobia bacterium RIFCSPLOWO2_12_FULL_59_9]